MNIANDQGKPMIGKTNQGILYNIVQIQVFGYKKTQQESFAKKSPGFFRQRRRKQDLLPEQELLAAHQEDGGVKVVQPHM